MKKNIAVIALGLMYAGSVLASPVLVNRPDLWTDAAATWTVSAISPNDSTPSEAGSGTYAGIRFTDGGSTPAAKLSATSGNFIGSFQDASLSVKFTLNSIEMAPAQQQGALSLYFVSGGNTWYYDKLYSPISSGLTPYQVVMGVQGDWTQIGGTPGAIYWNDLLTVSDFGFTLRGANNYVTQNYEIQDVEFTEFTVPEPETVWMILMVLASLGITFRSRLMELAGQVKARIRA